MDDKLGGLRNDTPARRIAGTVVLGTAFRALRDCLPAVLQLAQPLSDDRVANDGSPKSRGLPAGLIARSTLVVWLLASSAVHIVISIIAPGDAGTMNAMFSGAILLIVLILSLPVVLLIFPIAAFGSWPFRSLAINQPSAAYALAIVIGATAGFAGSYILSSRGWVDQLPGLVAGLVAGIAWVAMVRRHEHA